MRPRLKKVAYLALSCLFGATLEAVAQSPPLAPGPASQEPLTSSELAELDDAISNRRADFVAGRYKCLDQENKLWRSLHHVKTLRCAEVSILGGEMNDMCRTLVFNHVEIDEYLACAATNRVDAAEQDRVVNKYNQYTAPLVQYFTQNDAEAKPR